jgi:hypothetical protein
MEPEDEFEEDYTAFALSFQHNGVTGAFSELSKAFKAAPTLEHYLELRRQNPGKLIEVSTSWSLDWVMSNDERLQELGIPTRDVVRSLDADEAAASRLSLRLIELLVERRARESSGETHLVGRGEAVSDSLINYLIAMMLDALDWNDNMTIPRDLIVLIKHQLGADVSAEAKGQEVKHRRETAQWGAARLRAQGEAGSLRQIASMMRVSPSTVLRWFAETSFEEEVESVRKVLESDEFKEMQALAAELRKKRDARK